MFPVIQKKLPIETYDLFLGILPSDPFLEVRWNLK